MNRNGIKEKDLTPALAWLNGEINDAEFLRREIALNGTSQDIVRGYIESTNNLLSIDPRCKKKFRLDLLWQNRQISNAEFIRGYMDL